MKEWTKRLLLAVVIMGYIWWLHGLVRVLHVMGYSGNYGIYGAGLVCVLNGVVYVDNNATDWSMQSLLYSFLPALITVNYALITL